MEKWFRPGASEFVQRQRGGAGSNGIPKEIAAQYGPRLRQRRVQGAYEPARLRHDLSGFDFRVFMKADNEDNGAALSRWG